jgi:hypothetical protein
MSADAGFVSGTGERIDREIVTGPAPGQDPGSCPAAFMHFGSLCVRPDKRTAEAVFPTTTKAPVSAGFGCVRRVSRRLAREQNKKREMSGSGPENGERG